MTSSAPPPDARRKGEGGVEGERQGQKSALTPTSIPTPDPTPGDSFEGGAAGMLEAFVIQGVNLLGSDVYIKVCTGKRGNRDGIE